MWPCGTWISLQTLQCVQQTAYLMFRSRSRHSCREVSRKDFRNGRAPLGNDLKRALDEQRLDVCDASSKDRRDTREDIRENSRKAAIFSAGRSCQHGFA